MKNRPAARLAEADLAAARAIEPSYDAARGGARLTASLALLGAAGTGAATASAASAMTKSGVANGVVMKLLGVAALSSAVLTVDARAPLAPPPMAAQATATSSVPDVAPRTEQRAVLATKPSASDGPSAVVPAKPRVVARPQKRSSDGFARELREVAGARALLSADPSAALAAADEASSSQALAEEREIIAIRALVSLGRTEEAKTRARALVLRHPDSPFAPIARKLAAD